MSAPARVVWYTFLPSGVDTRPLKASWPFSFCKPEPCRKAGVKEMTTQPGKHTWLAKMVGLGINAACSSCTWSH